MKTWVFFSAQGKLTFWKIRGIDWSATVKPQLFVASILLSWTVFLIYQSLLSLSVAVSFPVFSFNPSCSQNLQLIAYNTFSLISPESCCLLVQLAATCPHPRGLTFKSCITGPDLITALICDIQTGLIMPQLRGIVWPPITTTCILIVSSPRPLKHAVCCLYFSHRLPACLRSKWHIYIQIISDRRVLPGRLSQTYLTRLMLWVSNASDSQHAWQQVCHVGQGIEPQSIFSFFNIPTEMCL